MQLIKHLVWCWQNELKHATEAKPQIWHSTIIDNDSETIKIRL